MARIIVLFRSSFSHIGNKNLETESEAYQLLNCLKLTEWKIKQKMRCQRYFVNLVGLVNTLKVAQRCFLNHLVQHLQLRPKQEGQYDDQNPSWNDDIRKFRLHCNQGNNS